MSIWEKMVESGWATGFDKNAKYKKHFILLTGSEREEFNFSEWMKIAKRYEEMGAQMKRFAIDMMSKLSEGSI